jgi:hypothetical protein
MGNSYTVDEYMKGYKNEYNFNIKKVHFEFVYKKEPYYQNNTYKSYDNNTKTSISGNYYDRLPSYNYYNYIRVHSDIISGIIDENKESVSEFDIIFDYKKEYYTAFKIYKLLQQLHDISNCNVQFDLPNINFPQKIKVPPTIIIQNNPTKK